MIVSDKINLPIKIGDEFMNQKEFKEFEEKLINKITSNTLTDEEIIILSTLIINSSKLFHKEKNIELLSEYTTKIIVNVIKQTLELISEEINLVKN
jgi:hypothetical protein